MVVVNALGTSSSHILMSQYNIQSLLDFCVYCLQRAQLFICLHMLSQLYKGKSESAVPHRYYMALQWL